MGKAAKEKRKTGKIVIANEKIFDGVPDEVKEQVNTILDGFASGEIDPEVVGEPCDFEGMKGMPCTECGNEKMSWMLEKNSSEVYYRCECGNNGWMYLHEFEGIKRKYGD